MYKYLGTKGSVLQLRLIFSVGCLFIFWLVISAFNQSSAVWVYVFLGIEFLLFTRLCFFFSFVKYNSYEIVVVNIWEETSYLKRDLVIVKPLFSFLPIYIIVFTGDKSYTFGTVSSRIGFTEDAIKYAEQMNMRLLSDDAPSKEKQV